MVVVEIVLTSTLSSTSHCTKSTSARSYSASVVPILALAWVLLDWLSVLLVYYLYYVLVLLELAVCILLFLLLKI